LRSSRATVTRLRYSTVSSASAGSADWTQIVVTADVGSLRNRVALQHSHRQFLLLADAQALTDNADDPA
jgi:hypothetical protein